MPLGLKDGLITQTGALPNGAATTYTGPINLGLGIHGETEFTRAEFEVDAPALTTGELANGATITYNVVVSANANLSSPTVLYSNLIVQTGAGGAGAPAATARFRLPNQIPLNGSGAAQPYLGIQTVNSGAGNCSSLNATLDVVV